ncbi:MAG: glycosyltransferase family 2 protein [Burkholderiales bacterium]|nr:glycosyltransferase family 2 protein [Burkholderiales bacterium]
MSEPGISIIICNRDYGRFLGAAIESCVTQDYPADRFETIVVDDGSTDDSRAVIARHAGSRGVIAVEQENRGQAAAFAAGLERASHDLVCFLDADDFFLPGKLAAVARAVDSLAPLPEHFFLCHDIELFDEREGVALRDTWFQLQGIARLGPLVSLDAVTAEYPYATPCGQVMRARTARAVLDVVPAWEWRQGADALLAHAAMLLAGVVHYLPEVRARYRLHGSNHFGAVRDGRYSPKPLWIARLPRLLYHLERFVDSLPLDEAQRASRLAYVKHLERIGRGASRVHRYAEPWMTIVIDAPAGDPDLAATVDACIAQSHEKVEVLLAAPAGAPHARLAPRALERARVVPVDPDDTQIGRLAAALAEARGDYLAFLAPGELPDPVFAERHLHAQRFLGTCALSSCDIRVINGARVLLHAGVFNGSGVWRQPVQMVPPFVAPLRDWIFPPLPANVLRRCALLDALVEHARAADLGPMADLAGWVLLPFCHALAGSIRINECLVSLRVEDAVAASYGHYSEPLDAAGAPVSPDVERTAEFLFELLCLHYAAFARVLPRAWRGQFVNWLMDRQSPALAGRLRALARRSGCAAAQALLDR